MPLPVVQLGDVVVVLDGAVSHPSPLDMVVVERVVRTVLPIRGHRRCRLPSWMDGRCGDRGPADPTRNVSAAGPSERAQFSLESSADPGS